MLPFFALSRGTIRSVRPSRIAVNPLLLSTALSSVTARRR
jgi:hypothetical protein